MTRSSRQLCKSPSKKPIGDGGSKPLHFFWASEPTEKQPHLEPSLIVGKPGPVHSFWCFYHSSGTHLPPLHQILQQLIGL